MAKSRRVQVTLSDEAFEVLEGLKEIQGRSLSSIVGEFVNLALPELRRVLEMVTAAKNASETGQKVYLEDLKRILGEEVVSAGGAISDLERHLQDSQGASESK